MGEWQEASFESCLDALIDYRGKSPTKSATGIPVLSAKVVKTAGLLRPIEQTISANYYLKWMTRGYPQVGDVIMTTEGPMGEVIQLDHETVNYALGQRIVCLRGKQGMLDNGFLRYLLTSPNQQAALASYATGTTVLGISQKSLRVMPISFPDYEQQHAIANVLSSLDDKIELNRRMNATLERQAQAIFRDWFVDFGPVRRKMALRAADGSKGAGGKATGGNSAEAQDSVAAMGGLIQNPEKATQIVALFPDTMGNEGLPLGWEEGTLDQLAKSIGDTVDPTSIDPTTPYIGLEHMPRKSIMLDDWGVASSVSSNKARFKTGQILFGKLRPYFHKVGIAPVDGVSSTDIVIIDGKRMADRALVASCVSSAEFVAFTDQGSSGTKMPRTSWTLMKRYPFVVAPENIRDAFSEICTPLHLKICSRWKKTKP